MNGFAISPHFDKNKVFILHKSELDKRFDPFYYVPELVELERKVLAKKPKKLRDYVVSLSSGATPKTTESEKYYTDAENGIPFLRVQNLSSTGVLEFGDCKFINKETHNGLLKRSWVLENDLLVKITGVGRMAVASVAPEGFEGNINQHIVVIKTKDKTTSETIAAFLNSDIGEKLATRRSAGGTRPALDYPALLSIPIIYDPKILAITQKVVEQKKQNEAQAEKLLAGIDNYLLKELGISLPIAQENTLESRMFTSRLKELSGNRFDPNYNAPKFNECYKAFSSGKYKLQKLKDVTQLIFQGVGRSLTEVENYILLKVKNIKLDGTIDYDDVENLNTPLLSKALCYGDIITPFIGEAVRQIKFSIFNKNENQKYFVDNNTGIIRLKSGLDFRFVRHCLASSLGKIQIQKLIGGGGVPFLGSDNAKKISLPIPPLPKQKEIAEHITAIRQQAQQLKDKTKSALEQASKEIEQILLGS